MARPARKRLTLAAVAAGATVAVLLGVAQLALPGIAERRIEDRLTERGGRASVEIRSRPAVRLLAGDGDRLRVRGTRLALDPDPDREVSLSRLNGFSTIDVRLRDVGFGPVRGRSLALTRRDGGNYRVRLRATVAPARALLYAGGRLGGLLGAAVGAGIGGRIPGGDVPIPIRVSAELAGRGDEVRVVRTSGSVAGVPADPLLAALAAAVARVV